MLAVQARETIRTQTHAAGRNFHSPLPILSKQTNSPLLRKLVLVATLAVPTSQPRTHLLFNPC